MKRLIVLLSLISLFSGTLRAAGEALDSELFPAEFLSAQREALGLSEAQLQAIDELMGSAKSAFEENKRQLDEAARALQTLLKEDQPDPDKADEKLRAVLDHEGDIKLLHMNTLLAVRHVLTPAQLAKARQLRDDLMAKAATNADQRKRLEKKLEDLRAAIHARFKDGAVPPELVERAKEIQQLMNESKEAEAERKAEEVISSLDKAKP
ncbi:MAG: periplasmic heavy metal sensor [Chthoniobacteraceae bacterium]